jgi:hypothetical protein
MSILSCLVDNIPAVERLVIKAEIIIQKVEKLEFVITACEYNQHIIA